MVARARKKDGSHRPKARNAERPQGNAGKSASRKRQDNGAARAFGQTTGPKTADSKPSNDGTNDGPVPSVWAGTTDDFVKVNASKLSREEKLALQSVDTGTLPDTTSEKIPLPEFPPPSPEKLALHHFNDLFNNRPKGTTTLWSNTQAHLDDAVFKRVKLGWDLILNGTTYEGLPMAVLQRPIWPEGNNLTSWTLNQYLRIASDESGSGYQLENTTSPLGMDELAFKKSE